MAARRCQQPRGDARGLARETDPLVFGNSATHVPVVVTMHRRVLQRTPTLRRDLGEEVFQGPLAKARQLARSKSAGTSRALSPSSSRDLMADGGAGSPALSPGDDPEPTGFGGLFCFTLLGTIN